MKYVFKHLKIAAAFLNISWKNSIEYMNDFVVLCIDFIVTMIATILFWKYLLVDYEYLGNWSVAGLIAIGIFGNASWAIGEILAGAWSLSEKITSGRLDKYLCRPVNTLFALLLEDMQLEEFIKGILSLIILMLWHSIKFKIPIHGLNLLFAICSMIVGVFIVAFVRCIYSCFSFWAANTEGFNFLIHMEDLQLDRYPLSIFNKCTKLVLLSIIPVGFVSCFPAMFYLGMVENRMLYLIFEIVIAAVMLFILSLLWKKGIQKYEATGG